MSPEGGWPLPTPCDPSIRPAEPLVLLALQGSSGRSRGHSGPQMVQAKAEGTGSNYTACTPTCSDQRSVCGPPHSKTPELSPIASPTPLRSNLPAPIATRSHTRQQSRTPSAGTRAARATVALLCGRSGVGRKFRPVSRSRGIASPPPPLTAPARPRSGQTTLRRGCCHATLRQRSNADSTHGNGSCTRGALGRHDGERGPFVPGTDPQRAQSKQRMYAGYACPLSVAT